MYAADGSKIKMSVTEWKCIVVNISAHTCTFIHGKILKDVMYTYMFDYGS